MRLSATVNNPYNLAFGFNDTLDTTTVGNWYAAFAGRLGYAVNDVLFYLKGGVGFTQAWPSRPTSAPPPARTAAARR